METRANYVLVGSCVLAAIASIVIFIFWLGSNQLRNQQDTFYTYFTGSVAGLSTGSPVRYRGVPVGSVGNIEIDPQNVERIRVTLKLNQGAPIKTDTIASLEMAGITGGSYVELSGGTQTSTPLAKDGDDPIPVIQSKDSALQSLVDDAPKLLGKINKLADSANDALSAENVKSIGETLKNLQSMTANLQNFGPQATEAMSNINKLAANLNTQLPRLIDTLRDDGASVKGAVDEFHNVAGNINSVIAENRAPLRDFTGSGLNELTGLISKLRGLTDTLTRVADRLDSDPQRYLFGGTSSGIDPAKPIGAALPVGASR
jgi:phospholipid/cholesterol/gamma-HCH transport system substrate-binding protein